MVNNILKIHLQNIIEFAKNANALRNEIEEEDITLNIDDLLNLTPEEKTLTNYLDSLDIETVLDIETIMYIGSDVSESQIVDKDFKESREYFRSVSQNDKDIMIDQMTGKMTLAEYLSKGMHKMNIY